MILVVIELIMAGIITYMNSLQLTRFLIIKNVFDKDLSENLIREDVDGEVQFNLLEMIVEQLISHMRCSFGKATSIVNWLKNNNEVPVVGPIVPQVISKESETMVARKVG